MSLPTLFGCLLLVTLASSQKNKERGLSKEFSLDKAEQEKVDAIAEEQLASERKIEELFAKIDAHVSKKGSSVDQHRQFTFTTVKSIDRGRNHRLNVLKVEAAIQVKEVPRDNIVPLLNEGFGPKVFCNDNCNCDINSPYRTADGSCNNLIKTTNGMASIPMRRWLKPDYADGVSSPRQVSVIRDDFLRSPRSISVKVHTPSTAADQQEEFTHMLMQWGQFLDHDITSTPTQQLPKGGYASTSVACCDESGNFQSELVARPECFPIKIQPGDRHFRTDCMNFVRSVQVENAQCNPAPVEQLNQITAYIDASNVYGSSKEEQNDLRTFSMGLLKVNDIASHLPEGTSSSCTSSSPPSYCFKAGDHRVNENPTLQSMHHIFMREHNRIAGILKTLNCNWGDEKLFQETRKIVGAIIQEITYDEYLPIVLGATTMNDYGLNLAETGHTNFYNTATDASIRNAFAAAAFRFGHSMIRDHLGSRQPDYTDLGDDLLSDVFGKTNQILTNSNREVGPYCRGLVKDCVQKVDRKMTLQVTDHLFTDGTTSFDLAALNIQRGRDHGLPSYVEWRAFCGIRSAVKTFGDLSDTHTADAIKQLETVYASVKDIDLFPGGLSENPVSGGLVGPTFACLLAKQFLVLKTGDRFWFEENNVNVLFTASQLAELRKASLSRVVCDNTDTTKIQENAFMKDDLKSCRSLPSINLTPWKETLGKWTAWSDWGPCDKEGIQRRTRSCEPCNCGGEGPNEQSRLCQVFEEPCEWTLWGKSNDITGYRTRQCQCPGTSIKSCRSLPSINLTPWKEILGKWTAWSDCDKEGIQRRTRSCEPFNCGREGPNEQSRLCQMFEGSPYEWTPWGKCNFKTGYRTRQCQCLGKPSEACEALISLSKEEKKVEEDK